MTYHRPPNNNLFNKSLLGLKLGQHSGRRRVRRANTPASPSPLPKEGSKHPAKPPTYDRKPSPSRTPLKPHPVVLDLSPTPTPTKHASTSQHVVTPVRVVKHRYSPVDIVDISSDSPLLSPPIEHLFDSKSSDGCDEIDWDAKNFNCTGMYA